MSSWKLFTGTGNDFRWEISRQESTIIAQTEAVENSDSRLPSMSDLLLQQCSNSCPTGLMFQTGLGNLVEVQKSSIAKAMSVFGEDDDVTIPKETLFITPVVYAGKQYGGDNGCGVPGSLFQTGSGKSVSISSAGLLRAKKLLGLVEDDVKCTFNDFEHMVKPSEPNGWHKLSHVKMKEAGNDFVKEATASPNSHLNPRFDLLINESAEAAPNSMQCEMLNSSCKPSPMKFQTAGGRSLSVSSDALRRARSLLGDPELGKDGNAVDPICSFFKDTRHSADRLNEENKDLHTSFSHQGATSKAFISPLHPSCNQSRLPFIAETNIQGINLIKKFDADAYENISNSNSDQSYQTKHSKIPQNSNSLTDSIESKIRTRGKSSRRPLVDLTNSVQTNFTNKKETTVDKRKLGIKDTISPFKRPRNSRFSTPMKSNISGRLNGMATVTLQSSCRKSRVSNRYPFQVQRMYVTEYFGVTTSHKHMLEFSPDQAQCKDQYDAQKYMFSDGSGSSRACIENFCHLLVQSGASLQYASKEWVANHYKWIVWKLACYDRRHLGKHSSKLLSESNVLEELKYRYEREVNHGHRSAIKRILEGDTPPSSMVVLCISAIHLNSEIKIGTGPMDSNGAGNSSGAKVELTDGWYAIDAILDGLLSNQLVSGKIYVGQKLRVWGAGLSGWSGPVSPLEESRTGHLVLHMNGTYRAHWADRLGLCNGVGCPLAFHCIKSTGGPVPQTLVGVIRIYPVLYKEKLKSGSSIIRSERMETKMIQMNNQRRTTVIEGIVSEFQRRTKDSCYNDSDSEDGAKILKMLETAAEPEVIMAAMTAAQLNTFSTYQAKLETLRQSDMEKHIEKALEDAGLGAREVTPFMRVRVTGLACKNNQGKLCHRDGLITIWDPTEKQRSELVEGQVYAIAGLTPLKFDSEILYLQGRGPSTKWKPLALQASKQFEPFFSPRKSVLLSTLGEVSLSSEFDIAAVVVHVGEAYTSARQRRQWVFVTDSSIMELKSEELSNSLLAISFCSPYTDDDSHAPINYNLAGSTVGFCNLIKRAKDQMNHLWVADATENSTYFLNFDFPCSSHLKNAASSVQRWEKISHSIIGKLTEKVISIISDSKS